MTPESQSLIATIVGGALCLGGLLLALIDTLGDRYPDLFDRIGNTLLGHAEEATQEPGAEG